MLPWQQMIHLVLAAEASLMACYTLDCCCCWIAVVVEQTLMVVVHNNYYSCVISYSMKMEEEVPAAVAVVDYPAVERNEEVVEKTDYAVVVAAVVGGDDGVEVVESVVEIHPKNYCFYKNYYSSVVAFDRVVAVVMMMTIEEAEVEIFDGNLDDYFHLQLYHHVDYGDDDTEEEVHDCCYCCCSVVVYCHQSLPHPAADVALAVDVSSCLPPR